MLLFASVHYNPLYPLNPTPHIHTALSVYLGAPAIPGDFGATHGIDVDRLGWCVGVDYIQIVWLHTLQTHPHAPIKSTKNQVAPPPQDVRGRRRRRPPQRRLLPLQHDAAAAGAAGARAGPAGVRQPQPPPEQGAGKR